MSGELTTFLLRGWAELIENGHCTPNYVPPLADKRIIFCTIDGRIVSLLMWEWNNQSTFINFTIVDPAYRKNGLYQIMHRYYDSRVSSGGAVDSKSQLHISNTAIIQAAMKQGYEIEYYRMIKRY
jgi:hypothetical protein